MLAMTLLADHPKEAALGSDPPELPGATMSPGRQAARPHRAAPGQWRRDVPVDGGSWVLRGGPPTISTSFAAWGPVQEPSGFPECANRVAAGPYGRPATLV